MSAEDYAATILVVDDNPTKRYVISSWLRRAGHTVVEAATGTEALDRLATTTTVDLVVLDVVLPDIGGFEVCERIKANPATGSLPVVHISATAVDVSDRTQGLTRGADAYLAEPIDPDELIATVHALLRYFRARKRAEHLAQRLADLAETTLHVNQATTFAVLLEAAAAGTANMFRRPAAITAVTPEGEPLVAGSAGPGADPDTRPWRDGTPATPASPGSTLHPGTAPPWPGLAGVPDGTPLWVVSTRHRPQRPAAHIIVPAEGLNADDATVLTQLGQAVALAIDAMRAQDEDRRTALTLQRSLLPRAIPRVAGIDLAVRYVPASTHAEIGGDFYELLAIDDTLIAALGDVAGHSLRAATVMAELRHVLRAYVAEGHPPDTVVKRLNSMMRRLLPDETATLCLLQIDPRTGHGHLANAGHLPPIMLTADGQARFIEGRTPLLGVDINRTPGVTLHLPPGATLVMVTDGLIERRTEPLDDSLERLRQAITNTGPDLEELCDRLLSTFVTGPNEDDVAIVALRRTP
ncbi:SpoIIE family protein phosphatase [Actinoplanes sp. NPDC049668]|uniref:SpoIIE family protein phosphatase n=1 Tax=unclassified Actinoplanes TaxID=2626549 RepID=UPI00339E97EB